jgi:two-component system, NtrC family, response regulator GlrR
MHTLVVFSALAGTASEELRRLQAILNGQASWQIRRATKEAELSAILSEHTPSLILALVPRNREIQALEPLAASLAAFGLPVPIMPVLPEGASPEKFSIPERTPDFLMAPLRPAEVIARIQRVLDQEKKHSMAESCLQLNERLGLESIVGEHPGLVAVKSKLPLIARAEATVLISGETGTGKEVVARAIHYLSRRAHAPFLPVNCGAIPTELLESELFGHRRGAFTDARTSTAGLIAEAEGGTLFLDEVDTIPLPAQVKFLRFLDHKTYRSLGGASFQQADVRIVAASNADLESMVKSGALREDLFYRLNIIPIALPPLRERREDIPLLARHFLGKYTSGSHRAGWHFAVGFLDLLQSYEWPGNIRELENLICQIVTVRSPGLIGPEALPPRFHPHQLPPPPGSFREAKAQAVAVFVREYVCRLLSAYNWNITRAAQAAEKDRRAFARLVKKYGIGKPPGPMNGIPGGGSD